MSYLNYKKSLESMQRTLDELSNKSIASRYLRQLPPYKIEKDEREIKEVKIEFICNKCKKTLAYAIRKEYNPKKNIRKERIEDNEWIGYQEEGSYGLCEKCYEIEQLKR